MRTRCPAVLLVSVLASLAPKLALAEGPRVASDAFYAGVRSGPGAALAAGWDLDVYLTRNRAVSLGPGGFIAVLGADREDGRQQDYLIGIDIARLKVGLNEPGDEWRPYFALGGGFYYASLPDQTEAEVTVVPPDGVPVTGERAFAADDGFGGLMSVGIGVDWFATRHWGLTMAVLTHFTFGGVDRVPSTFSTMMLGLRFGI